MNAREFLQIAPVDMQIAIDNLPMEERGELERELDGLAQSAAWARGYVSQRYGAGCGDQGHDDAIKEANKNLAGVRKALGYTYPKQGAIRV